MTLHYTLHLKLAVPDFLSEPWHAEFDQAMNSIDQAIFNALIAANTTLWLNSTAYVIGDIVIDPQTGLLYVVSVAHTSAATPTTFAAFVAANPTFYTSFTLALATQAEAEAGIENTKYMSALRVAQAIAAQSPVASIASQAQAEAGTDNLTMMTPLRVAQSIAVRLLANIPGGRLTLTTGTPIMTAGVAAQTGIFYAPDKHSGVPLYDGTKFVNVDIQDELSSISTDTAKSPAAIGASKCNDWFVWTETAVVTISIAAPGVVSYTAHGLQAGAPLKFSTTGLLPTGLLPDTLYYVIAAGLTANAFQLSATKGGAAINTSGTQSGVHSIILNRLTHGPDWTSDSARSAGTALTRVKGIYLNSVALTNGPGASRGTYVGTTRSTAASLFVWTLPGTGAGGVAGNFAVWNMYNRVHTGGVNTDNTGSWSVVSITPRSKNNSSGNSVAFVSGLPEDLASAHNSEGLIINDGSGATVICSFCIDATNLLSTNSMQGVGGASVVSCINNSYVATSLGYHTWNATEAANAATAGITVFGSLVGPPLRNVSTLQFNFPM